MHRCTDKRTHIHPGCNRKRKRPSFLGSKFLSACMCTCCASPSFVGLFLCTFPPKREKERERERGERSPQQSLCESLFSSVGQSSTPLIEQVTVGNDSSRQQGSVNRLSLALSYVFTCFVCPARHRLSLSVVLLCTAAVCLLPSACFGPEKAEDSRRAQACPTFYLNSIDQCLEEQICFPSRHCRCRKRERERERKCLQVTHESITAAHRK